jgi:hypothetical protein
MYSFWPSEPSRLQAIDLDSVMIDDATIVEMCQRLLMDPCAPDAEVRRLSVMALLCNEDFRLRLLEWLFLDAPGRVDLRSLYH